MTDHRKSPYTDMSGNELFEGDAIAHPDGDSGVIVYDDTKSGPRAWRVKYPDGDCPWLPHQIGPKGLATKLLKNETVTSYENLKKGQHIVFHDAQQREIAGVVMFSVDLGDRILYQLRLDQGGFYEALFPKRNPSRLAQDEKYKEADHIQEAPEGTTFGKHPAPRYRYRVLDRDGYPNHHTDSLLDAIEWFRKCRNHWLALDESELIANSKTDL